jgi:hypothetical protein
MGFVGAFMHPRIGICGVAPLCAFKAPAYGIERLTAKDR